MKILDWLHITPAMMTKTPRWARGLAGSVVISGTVLFCALIFGSLFLFVYALFWPIDAALQAKAESLRNLGLILVAMLGFPFLIWRSLIAAKQAQTGSDALFNDKVRDASKDLAARKQVLQTLDANNPQSAVMDWTDDIIVRSMAIHNLEGLAMERPEFSPRIVRMLASYVRGNFPAENTEPTEGFETRRTPRMDLQDAITTIGRILETAATADPSYWRLDLSGTNLDGVDLRNGYFRAVNFTAARLEGAFLVKGNFQGALFMRTLLNYSNFTDADLTGANLSKSAINMPNTPVGFTQTFDLAKITGVDFSGADLSAIKFLGSPDTLSQTFGNSDTQLPRYFHHQKPTDEELESAFIFRNGSNPNENDDEYAELYRKVNASGFQNWSPFTGNDMANHSIKIDLMKKLGLNKWPYMDV